MAKEGFKFIIPSGVLGVGFLLSPFKFVAVSFFLLMLFFMLFFRDPKRVPPNGEGLILAPADGRVIFVGDYEGEFGKRKRVSIFMRIYDVHINRIPLSGEVEDVVYLKGGFSIASNESAHETNERNILKVKTDKGDYILMQVAGKVARRIVCRVKKGDRVERGEKFGMIMFGSRVEVLLPPAVEVFVRAGDKVRGGETVIGRVV